MRGLPRSERSRNRSRRVVGVATFVLTVVGDDRPGLVSSLSSTVADHGGNWLTSRMAQLAGQFAGIVLVEVPTERAGQLRESLEALAATGLRVEVTAAGEPAPERGPGRRPATGATGATSATSATGAGGGDREFRLTPAGAMTARESSARSPGRWPGTG